MPDTFVTAHDARMPSPHAAGLPAMPVRFAAVSRSGRARTPAAMFSFWLQLRGSAQVAAAEGSFVLRPGDWIALERGSMPEVQSDGGLTLGLMLTADVMHGALDSADRGLLVGRGTMPLHDRRIALRLWRQCAALPAEAGIAAVMRSLKPLLKHWQAAQEPFAEMIERCPGRSFHRKTRIFSRVQKARLFLEGNPQRMLRIEDLMELTRFSSWWLSKTFHAVYHETLQKASMRLRMQRARDLLRDSHLSITELAEACGFHDPCSFARQFKAWHGETASSWRACHQPAATAPGPGGDTRMTAS
ncbi:helix-turn-helix transcriptional regulator [Lysobacter solisilvae (ex Woo and Kim 2020)]|uniref:Helix-turn-helix transcriptional regulator n=1 Tax=Agrilutibacter terrestris TaxID=2865112 RepID=A0A7H0FYK4_9GAMM|nr:AraC family transcriptional regulator [Lysobacter terrestris]QNP41120.1 helix-turn-helix transcriptional regulator [Lysobacter terrestris]